MRYLSYFQFFGGDTGFPWSSRDGRAATEKVKFKRNRWRTFHKIFHFLLHASRPWWASAHGYWTSVIDRTSHSTTQIHFKIRSSVWEACLVNLNLPCTKLCSKLWATLIRQVRSSRIDKITYTTLAVLSLRPNFQKAFYKTNCNVLG